MELRNDTKANYFIHCLFYLILFLKDLGRGVSSPTQCITTLHNANYLDYFQKFSVYWRISIPISVNEKQSISFIAFIFGHLVIFQGN